MELLIAVLLARLVDPVTALVGLGIGGWLPRWWAPVLAGIVATIAAEAALAAMQPGRPLLGFALIGGFLAGAVWGAAGVMLRRLARRKGP